MPLFKQIQEDQSWIGIWKITENCETLLSHVELSQTEKEVFNDMRSDKRRCQWLAVRALLKSLDTPQRIFIEYDDNGKPYVGDDLFRLSITHSGEMACVQISQRKYCGIDIQEYSNKMDRLAPKFVRADEFAFIPKSEMTDYLNLIWTMKEAVFKHFGTSIEFKRQIAIAPFKIAAQSGGVAIVETPGKVHQIGLKWMRIDDYFLTYLY